jgi:Ca-activated chloride channel homolog
MKKLFLILITCCGIIVSSAQTVEEYITKGNQYYRQSEFELAERLYREAIKAQPDNEVAQRNLANALYKQKKYNEATEVYKALSANSPDKNVRSASYYNAGVINSRLKDLEGSIENYKAALRINPDDKEARENLQKALLELKKKQQQQQQQQNKSSSNMNQKQAEQKLKDLQQKEKQIQQRLQNQKGGVPMPNDW